MLQPFWIETGIKKQMFQTLRNLKYGRILLLYTQSDEKA